MTTLDITAYTFQILSERNRVFERLAIEKVAIETEHRHLGMPLGEADTKRQHMHVLFIAALREMDVEEMTRTLAEYRKAQAEFWDADALNCKLQEEMDAKSIELEAYKKETDDIILGLRLIVADEGCSEWAAVALRTQYNEGTLHA
jgi:hypothetical protein